MPRATTMSHAIHLTTPPISVLTRVVLSIFKTTTRALNTARIVALQLTPISLVTPPVAKLQYGHINVLKTTGIKRVPIAATRPVCSNITGITRVRHRMIRKTTAIWALLSPL